MGLKTHSFKCPVYRPKNNFVSDEGVSCIKKLSGYTPTMRLEMANKQGIPDGERPYGVFSCQDLLGGRLSNRKFESAAGLLFSVKTVTLLQNTPPIRTIRSLIRREVCVASKPTPANPHLISTITPCGDRDPINGHEALESNPSAFVAQGPIFSSRKVTLNAFQGGISTVWAMKATFKR